MIRYRLGLFDPTANQPYLTYGAADINTDAVRASNVQAAQEGLVLLQNNNGTLPFTTGGTTLVVGFAGNSTASLVSNYVGQYCYDGTDNCYNSILQAIGAPGESTAFSQGCTDPSTCPSSMVTAAATAAAAASTTRVVLVLGISQAIEAEQRDRQVRRRRVVGHPRA